MKQALRWTSLVFLAVAACSCAPQSKGPERKVDYDAEVRKATKHYEQLVQRMDNKGIAAMFTEGGFLVNGNQEIRGSEAIEKYLDTFKQYHVQSESLGVRSLSGNAKSVHVLGDYHQVVRLPAGNVVDARGKFVADWVRGKEDVWLLRRMAAYPDQAKPAGAD